MKIELDNLNPVSLQLSNDAFCMLYFGEDPIDTDNVEEAEEVNAMFPHGFLIIDYDYVENSDLVECVFVPYIDVSDNIYDHTHDVPFDAKYKIELFNDWHIEFKYNDNSSSIDYRFVSSKYGPKPIYTAQVVINAANKREFTTQLGSVIPLDFNITEL